MANTITKTYVNSKKQTVSKTYVIDADYTPKAVDDICAEFIEAYCVANGETDWLVATCEKKTTATRKIKDADGNVTGKKEVPINYTFANIRSDFVKKFFPSILKGENSGKPLSFAEQMKAKYAKK